jgi:hypothetical protein
MSNSCIFFSVKYNTWTMLYTRCLKIEINYEVVSLEIARHLTQLNILHTKCLFLTPVVILQLPSCKDMIF